jgi:hypothetical protein
MKYKAVFQVESSEGFAKYLPDSILAPGVNHFLLLDQAGKLVAQRLYYNINGMASNIDLAMDDVVSMQQVSYWYVLINYPRAAIPCLLPMRIWLRL